MDNLINENYNSIQSDNPNNLDLIQLDNYIKHLNDKLLLSSRNKAILSFRYDDLERKTTYTQVFIIFLSTMVTFLESLKSYYNLNIKILDIIGIVLTTLIALVMAIYRYFEIDKNKEIIGKSLTEHVFIINKFGKIGNSFMNIKLNTHHYKIEDLAELTKTYDTEIFDYFVSIRENFDTIFSSVEMIKYKKLYRKYYLKQEILKHEINLIKNNRDAITTNYVKKNNCIKKYCCCKSMCIDYYGFISDAEELNARDIEANRSVRSVLSSRSISMSPPQRRINKQPTLPIFYQKKNRAESISPKSDNYKSPDNIQMKFSNFDNSKSKNSSIV